MSSLFLGPALHLEVASQPNRHLVCRRQGKELFEPAAPGRLGRLCDQVVPSNGRKLGRLRVKHETGPVMCLHTHIYHIRMYIYISINVCASTHRLCVYVYLVYYMMHIIDIIAI